MGITSIARDRDVHEEYFDEVLHSATKNLFFLFKQTLPYRLRRFHVKTPFKNDKIHIVFKEPVEVAFEETGLVEPLGDFDLYINRFNKRIRSIETSIEHGILWGSRWHVLTDSGESAEYYRGEELMTYMLVPWLLNAVKEAEIVSQNGDGAKWLYEFIETAEEIANSNAVKMIDPKDFGVKDLSGNIYYYRVFYYYPAKDIELFSIILDVGTGFVLEKGWVLRTFSLLLSFKGKAGTAMTGVEGIYGNSMNMRSAPVEAGGITREEAVELFLNLLSEPVLKKIQNAVTELVEAYKVALTTLTYMDAIERDEILI